MATITKKQLENVSKMMDMLTDDAKSKIRNILATVDWSNPDKAKTHVTEAVKMICQAYGSSAGQIAADFYDVARELSIGEKMGAVSMPGYSEQYIERQVSDFAQLAKNGSSGDFINNCVTNYIDYELQRAFGNTMFGNGKRDKVNPRWARVPAGADACKFCIMLASRGPVYHTAETAGKLNHYHPHDRCRIVPMWDTVYAGKSRRASLGTTIEGYDPDALYEQYCSFANDEKFLAKLAKAKGKQMRDGITHAAVWARNYHEGNVSMKSVGEVSEYIRGADSYEDLMNRIEVVKEEFPYYGIDLGSKDHKQFERDMRETRLRIMLELEESGKSDTSF